MDCTTLQAILTGQVEDDLGAAESQAFEAHLRACDACREVLAQAEGELEPLVEHMEPPVLPAAAWERVTQAVKADVARPALVVHPGGASSGARFPRGVAVAAAFLIAVGIGALLPLEMFKGLTQPPVSATPGPIDINPAPPPAPRPIDGPGSTPPSSTASGPVIVAGTHAEVRRLEFDAARFDATAVVFDCADEDVVLITVRDL